ncbi:hypothetical protein EJB05_42724, partial [Eragrostis curvula]
MAGNDDQFLAGGGGGVPILLPRLEDAGLEDCALPPESIAEAFSLAAEAVSSRLARFPLYESDDEDDRTAGGCVDDAVPARGPVPDVLVGGGSGDGGADEVVVVGGGGGVGGDKLVVGGSGEEEDRVVVVGEERGEKMLGKEEGCVEGVGEGISEPERALGDEEEEDEVVVAAEKMQQLRDRNRIGLKGLSYPHTMCYGDRDMAVAAEKVILVPDFT